jgi:sporulation protein YlmC with PRC-barrel domain
MDSHEVKGRPVVGIADGTRVGTVDRVYLDLAARRVIGFGIATAGRRFGTGAGEPEPTLAASAVRSLGPDALTVEDAAAAHAAWVAGNYQEVTAADDLVGRKVVTEGGTDVGHVAAVEFDAVTFAVTGLAVSSGVFRSKTAIPATSIVRIGPDVVVVADADVTGP